MFIYLCLIFVNCIVLNKGYKVASLSLAFYYSSMNIQQPDSLCCGATELAILCMDGSTDISNALIFLQITTPHTSTSTTYGKSQWQLKNEQTSKEPTLAYIHHVLGITSFLPEDSKQTIITLVECSKLQIILITMCVHIYIYIPTQL